MMGKYLLCGETSERIDLLCGRIAIFTFLDAMVKAPP